MFMVNHQQWQFFSAESGGSVYQFSLTLEEDIPQSLKEEVATMGYS